LIGTNGAPILMITASAWGDELVGGRLRFLHSDAELPDPAALGLIRPEDGVRSASREPLISFDDRVESVQSGNRHERFLP
jgi:hypothetical protein